MFINGKIAVAYGQLQSTKSGLMLSTFVHALSISSPGKRHLSCGETFLSKYVMCHDTAVELI